MDRQHTLMDLTCDMNDSRGDMTVTIRSMRTYRPPVEIMAQKSEV
jgi:hypothetical protein